MTNDRTKRPTMGGSIKPTFYWPKRTKQAEQTARARYTESRHPICLGNRHRGHRCEL